MLDVLFVTPNRDLSLWQEVNGTMLLATQLLQDDFQVELLRFASFDSLNKDYPLFIRQMTDRILELQPKCVSFYCMCETYHIMMRLAANIKQFAPQIHTVFGGPQATATAMDTMKAADYVDYICSGEGELTVTPFFQGLLRGQGNPLEVAGVYGRRDGQIVHCQTPVPMADLDTLPEWDPRLSPPLTKEYFDKTAHSVRIDSGRGCPYNCTFCCTKNFWRRVYRLKSPDRLIQEIRNAKERYNTNSFCFSHDAFTANMNSVHALCDRLIAEMPDIRWQCSTRLNCVNQELLLKMKKAGLFKVGVGIETGSPRMQKITNKNLNLEQLPPMVKFCKEQRITTEFLFMYGFPEETEEDLQLTLEVLCNTLEQGANGVQMAYCVFHPSTQITEQNYDNLVFDPSINVIHRNIFGYKEELDLIRQNKPIFPFYYHLPTKVRDEYRYLSILARLYQLFTGPMSQLRQLYGGDLLKLYKDFEKANPLMFQDIDKAIQQTKDEPLTQLQGLLELCGHPQTKGIYEQMRYMWTERQFRKGKFGPVHLEQYNVTSQSLRDLSAAPTAGTCRVMYRKQGNTIQIATI